MFVCVLWFEFVVLYVWIVVGLLLLFAWYCLFAAFGVLLVDYWCCSYFVICCMIVGFPVDCGFSVLVVVVVFCYIFLFYYGLLFA